MEERRGGWDDRVGWSEGTLREQKALSLARKRGGWGWLPWNQAAKEGRGQTRGPDAEPRAGDTPGWLSWGLKHKRWHRGCWWPGDDVPSISSNCCYYYISMWQGAEKGRQEPGRWCQMDSSGFELWFSQVVALETGKSSLTLLHLSSSIVKRDNYAITDNFHQPSAQYPAWAHSLVLEVYLQQH